MRRRGNPEDLPYGPGNPDYEYDGWRERRDEEESAKRLDPAKAWPFPTEEKA